MKNLHDLKKNIINFIFALILCFIIDISYVTMLMTTINDSHILIIIFWIIAILSSISITVWAIIEWIISIIDYNKQLDIVLSNIDKILNLEEKDSNDKT